MPLLEQEVLQLKERVAGLEATLDQLLARLGPRVGIGVGGATTPARRRANMQCPKVFRTRDHSCGSREAKAAARARLLEWGHRGHRSRCCKGK